MLQSDTLGAMTETGIENLAVFEALCEASAEVLRLRPAQRCRHALGHDRDRH